MEAHSQAHASVPGPFVLHLDAERAICRRPDNPLGDRGTVGFHTQLYVHGKDEGDGVLQACGTYQGLVWGFRFRRGRWEVVLSENADATPDTPWTAPDFRWTGEDDVRDRSAPLAILDACFGMSRGEWPRVTPSHNITEARTMGV